MAKLVLADGRTIPVVSPTLWDGVEVERETGWDRKKYAEMMKSANVQTAFSIFASMRRAGSPVPFLSIMERTDLIQRIVAQPGDIARAEQESEGEQEPDPQGSATPVAAVAG
ncbi:hypothetical protein [Microbacterium allomyrinae]|uniref:Tail assembly chaperone n=1 Tax=Microbacterium allomyrinae TaxID=2830666 RepID=A0A9X1S278_9MICO|nr:hypothetical protein [Microbacterium allomyrinae]MCC2030613.1 hypothetical protein [Microbacterium allomyrinae]